MKVRMRKSVLLSAVDQMRKVCSKGIKSEYDMGDRVTISVEDGKVIFATSNGHLDAWYTVTPDDDNSVAKNEELGAVTVSASKFHALIKNLPTESDSSDLVLWDDGNNIKIIDPAHKKREAKLPKDTRCHDVSIPSKAHGDMYTIETAYLSKGITKVSPFVTQLLYKTRYLMTCFHFLPNETRLVCGNGLCFAIFSVESSNPTIKNDDGVKKLIPATQAMIINSLLGASDSVALQWTDDSKCYIKPDKNLDLLLKGIPNEEYIPYEIHAFRTQDAKLVLDVSSREFRSAVNLASACHDKEHERSGSFLSCEFAANDGLQFNINEGRYQSECHMPCGIYSLNGKSNFVSNYAVEYLEKVSGAIASDNVRFYCVDEKGVVICEDGDVCDSLDEKGVPIMKESVDKTRSLFFFAAITESNSN